MNFDTNNKAIYLQIADIICDCIMNGSYDSESRLPSVREYASMAEVNANTVMRAYDCLSAKGLIYNKRGIGFFVATDAKVRIITDRGRDLIENRLPPLFRLMDSLGISPDDLKSEYERFINSK